MGHQGQNCIPTGLLPPPDHALRIQLLLPCALRVKMNQGSHTSTSGQD